MSVYRITFRHLFTGQRRVRSADATCLADAIGQVATLAQLDEWEVIDTVKVG